MAQKLAQNNAKTKPTRTKEEIVPKRYHQFMNIFDEEKSKRFPPKRPWDHAIDLKEDYVPKDCRIIPLSPLEKESLDTWLKEMEETGYIRKSKSPQASPFFFVGKKMGNYDQYKTIGTLTHKQFEMHTHYR
jgi:hypothetical protein